MHQTYSPHNHITTTTAMNPQFPEHEHLNCPRCDSSNTKFCYYNNYNLSQPRHFCKNCRRYWTKGGTLRNIPVGGGTRKTAAKRASSSGKRPADSDHPTIPSPPPPPRDESKETILGYRSDPMKLDGESFESMLKSNQRVEFGLNLSGGADSISPVTTTPSPPPRRAEETSGILGYRSDRMKLEGENFESMMKSNQRLQIGSFMDGLRPNLSGGADSPPPPRDSPLTTSSPPPPLPRAEAKAETETETETSGSLGYRSDRMKLDGESFESMLKSNQRLQFGGLRPNFSGGSEEEGVIRTPANTGGSQRQFLSLNGDDEIGGGGGGGGYGGRDESSGGGNRWTNLSIFTPDGSCNLS